MSALQRSHDAEYAREYDQICAAYHHNLGMALAHCEAMRATGSVADQRAAEQTVSAISYAHCKEIMRRGLPNYTATLGPTGSDVSNYAATLGARAPNPYVV